MDGEGAECDTCAMYGTDEQALHTTDTSWVKPLSPDPHGVAMNTRIQWVIGLLALLGLLTVARFGANALAPGGLCVVAAIELATTSASGRSTRWSWIAGATGSLLCVLIWMLMVAGVLT
jgi:hypothetical protein